MSQQQLFTQIVECLKESPELAIDGAIYKEYLVDGLWPEPQGRWARTMDIYAYPYIEAHDVDILNEHLFRLANAVPASRIDAFRRSADGLYIGRVNYFESIGRISLEAKVTVDALQLPGEKAVSEGWSARQEHELEQMTAVHIFPNAQRARDAGSGFNVGFIPDHNGDLLKLRRKHTRVQYNFPPLQ